MKHITDEQIIRVLTEHGRCMTYVVTNWLRDIDRSINTPSVLRRLKKLESQGRVLRVRSVYKTQICWSVSDANHS